MSSVQSLTCPTVELSNWVQMPIFGTGTSHTGGFSQETVLCAVQDCGIRLIDTSQCNGFERQLAEVIRDSVVPRSDLWLTNKLKEDYGYETAKKAFHESCSRMGVEYLDIYMLHWPGSMEPGRCNRGQTAESWRALEELYKEGLCRSIGVNKLIEYCHQEGIAFQGYCPLAKGQALSNPTIIELAHKYGQTPAQICIRWSIQVFGFCLEEEDMETINKLHDGRRVLGSNKRGVTHGPFAEDIFH